MSSSIDYFDCPKCGGNAYREQDNRTCEITFCCSDCDWDGESDEADDDDDYSSVDDVHDEDGSDYCDFCRHLGENTCAGARERCWERRYDD
jgi:hypothetical protein